MKTIYKVLIVFAAINLASCKKDLLNKTPKDRLSPTTFYQNETQVKMALVGIYNAIQPNATPSQFFQFDFESDNAYCQDAWQGSKEVGEWQTTSNSWAPNAKWSQDFAIISRANEFLKDVATANVDAVVKSQMSAEAKFLRGYAYTDLIAYFGDVPLITQVQLLSDAYVSRTAKATVLTQIVADLTDAAAALPTSYSGTDVGRATKGAALAYKAKVLLYNEKWADAAQAAQDVINLKAYSLYPNYSQTFDEAHENNSEVIFDIQYIPTTQPQPWPSSALSLSVWPTPNVTADLIDSYYMTNGLPITNSASGYNSQNPYLNRDPRLAASVVLPGSQWGSTTYIPANDVVPSGARPRKYAAIGIADPNNCSLNTILMRYADVLLIRAEALIESGSTSAEIYTLIDQVRARVNMPKVEAVEGTGLSQSQLRVVLRHERRVEFFMEGTRYADMLRWKDQSLVHDAYGYDKSLLSNPASTSTWQFKQAKLETRTFNAAKGWLWPVPQADIDINKKLLPNNPGY
ncbi:RagB/SusD family nutrient uptake outer membrane protein [Mucilaginibacter sabulilitoris]|uniref:RagB/SusD family nutrient uptake outer membrane protein n=1 Tax=Mucilaginibacter sabulilitoris TaxID=1173583 RepID=A0ABZ0THF0_9SPHI|nr:RagB/SusD family nutrient uptake outer membrane protein [Mucilaginibacter sabulilitoris]WPU92236.1 RagB/SusD family nutrient uptake outer membrane protein [Mucilaginibacter sabulilitoris]